MVKKKKEKRGQQSTLFSNMGRLPRKYFWRSPSLNTSYNLYMHLLIERIRLISTLVIIANRRCRAMPCDEIPPDPYKVYVEVTAVFSPEGKITPVSFRWEDGRVFEIDRILMCVPGRQQRPGAAGCGIFAWSGVGRSGCFWIEIGGLWRGTNHHRFNFRLRAFLTGLISSAWTW